MPSDSFEQLLDRAASWFGIGAGFWDIFGHYHTTSVAAKQSILRALGVAAERLGARARFVVRRENGESGEFEVNLWELPQVASVEMDGRTWVRVQVAL